MNRKLFTPVLDDQMRSDICAILGVGGTTRLAAQYVGCDVRTIARTARRDPAFAEQLERATSKHEIIHLKNIDEAAKNRSSWRAAVWALERTYPERYAPRKPDTITTEQTLHLVTQLASIVVSEVSQSEDRARLLKKLERLTAGLKRPERRKSSAKRKPR